jgi:hypothetical protein
MEVYDSQYLNSVFFPEQELIEMNWKPSTEKMTEEEYKQETLNINDIVLKFRPKKILFDASNMFFVVVPELQEWTNREGIPVSLSVGMNKSAFVVSKDLFSQVSIEQTMEEQAGSQFINRYFDNKEDARKWLLSI